MQSSEAFQMDEARVNCQGNYIPPMMNGLNMKSETDRRQTFIIKTWLYNHIQDPGTLAAAGLFYTGIDDKVKCPFCYGILKKWERSDVPYIEHAKYFPKCGFICGYDVGNIPISLPRDVTNMRYYNGSHIVYNGHQCIPSSISPVSPNPLPYTVNGVVSSPVVQNGQTTVIYKGVPQPLGDFQDFYKHQENRLNSFSNWPQNLPQTPEMLSEAGFYHKATPDKPDRVKCAYCTGKLFNWQVDDDPWIEHARCFPQCKYVQLCMGRDFVKDLLGGQEHQEHVENGHGDQLPLSAHSHHREPSSSTSTSTSASAPSTISRTSKTQTSSNPSTPQTTSTIPQTTSEDPVSARMTSEPVQAVLQMGFPEQTVKQTVERCVRERPDHFPPAEELASILMELEDQLPVETTEPTPVLTPLQRLMASQSSGRNVSSVAHTNGFVHNTVNGHGCGDISPLTTATGNDFKIKSDPVSTVQVNGMTRPYADVTINGTAVGQNLKGIDTASLKSENSKLKDQFLCKICMENFVRVTFMPCGHLVCCASCSTIVSECPICRSHISGFVRTYF